MIHFKTKNGEIESMSYRYVTAKYFAHPISKEHRNLIVNLMLFLETFANEQEIEFHLLSENDWARLVHHASIWETESKASLLDE